MTRARKKVVVICAGEQGRMYVTKQAQDGTNVHVMGFFDDRVDDRLQAASLPANYLGKVDNEIYLLPLARCGPNCNCAAEHRRTTPQHDYQEFGWHHHPCLRQPRG